MNNISSSTKIYVKQSTIKKAGRGVFALSQISQGAIIEQCPVLVLPRKDYPLVKQTILRNYYFMWGKTTSAICFGFGSLYNHSYHPNATYQKLIKDSIIQFVALRNIEKNEEVTVNYNYGVPENNQPLWITDIKD